MRLRNILFHDVTDGVTDPIHARRIARWYLAAAVLALILTVVFAVSGGIGVASVITAVVGIVAALQRATLLGWAKGSQLGFEDGGEWALRDAAREARLNRDSALPHDYAEFFATWLEDHPDRTQKESDTESA